MNKRQARREALLATCALIRINVENGDYGDFESNLHKMKPEDVDRFLDALKAVADELWRKAERLRDKRAQ